MGHWECRSYLNEVYPQRNSIEIPGAMQGALTAAISEIKFPYPRRS